jgi:hypothetical protein
VLAIGASLLLSGCAWFAPPPPAPAPAPAPEAIDASVYNRAVAERAELLARENERLRADLRAAEETLLEVESGMRGTQRRAEAVSKLAEAHIQVDRAARRAPWRTASVAEARDKLAEAERQLADGHLGSAIFFVSRASRIAAALDAEADWAARWPGARRVRPRRANLRAQPSTESSVIDVLPEKLPVFVEATEGDWALVRTVSGQVGWLRGDLLSR